MALTWMCSASAWAAAGYVYDAAGEVTAATGKNTAQRIVKNSTIVPNTLIKTGDKSYAVLKFEDGQVVTLQANSTFQVRRYNYDSKQTDKNIAVFSMFKGGMRLITGLIGQRDKKAFRLATPNATIGIRGTEFMVAMVKGAVYSQVVTGSIRLTNDAGTSVFKAGQSVVASSAKSLPTTISAAKLPQGIFSQLESISAQAALQAPSIAQAPVPAKPANVATASGAAASAGSLPTAGISIAAGAATAQTAIPSATLPAAGSVTGIAALPIIPATPPSSPAAKPSLSGKPGVDYFAPREPKDLSVFNSPIDPAIPAASDAALVSATAGAARNPAAATSVTRNEAAAGLFGKHNFTATGIATGEICVFCHAPQGVEAKVAAPLWNRSRSLLSDYQAYSTLASATSASSGSVSMACLSCHDGTQAPNVAINTPRRNRTGTMNTSSTSISSANIYGASDEADRMLRGHHPVGMEYGGGGTDNARPGAPTNFEDFRAISFSGSGTGTVWWLDTGNKGRQTTDMLLFTRTDLPSEESKSRPYVECASCHDPHKISNPTFLRVPDTSRSSLCLTCHIK